MYIYNHICIIYIHKYIILILRYVNIYLMCTVKHAEKWFAMKHNHIYIYFHIIFI